MIAIKKNGMLLKYTMVNFTNDNDIVYEALLQNKDATIYASRRLKIKFKSKKYNLF